MPTSGKKISLFEFTGYVLILLGLLILLWGVWQFNLIERVNQTEMPEQHERFGQYGEFIGGIVGSLWALAGVFLFFATLTYQKREFELQREELHKTQKIFQQQNFSTLFTSILTKHNEIVTTLKASDLDEAQWRGINFFILFKDKVLASFMGKLRALPQEQRTQEVLQQVFQEYFRYHFSFYQISLNPYLSNLRVLFSLIDRYRTDTADEEEYYSFITKSNLSVAELFLIYHLTYFNILPDLKELCYQFDLFDKLPEDLRVQRIIRQELPASGPKPVREAE